MASVVKMKLRYFYINLFIWITILGLSESQKAPRLIIYPIQEVQRKPVGKPLMLTCRPDVPDVTLVTDFRWRDNANNTVLPQIPGKKPPPMYSEMLQGKEDLALYITSLQESMAGTYYCSASYANTELLETSVKIETFVPITWKDAPENQYPILNSDYSVRCEVTANPPPTVDWLRNSDPIKSSNRYVIETRGLLIRNVQESDDGIYTCRAAVTETGELAERNIRVEVHIKPEVDPFPTSLEAIEGQSFSTFCNGTGKPVPEFSWIRKSTQRNVADADRFMVNPQTGQMSITPVDQFDYDTYTCRATNAAGFAESTTLLNVIVRPRIYELINVTVATDQEGVIVCKAYGRPPPEITFRRWGSTEEFLIGYQPTDDRIQLVRSANEENGESSGTLRISPVIREDDGLYECVARNKGDTGFKIGHIAVEYAPNFEHMIGLPPVFSWEERRANVSCLAQGFPNATIEWRLNERVLRNGEDENIEIQGTGPRSDLLIRPRDRRYYTAYKCVATNRLGQAEHNIELREARVPELMAQALPVIVTATSITFDLVGPPTQLGMPITAYSAEYKEERSRDWSTSFNRTWSAGSIYVIEGLRPQTSYNFRFAARNQVGLGPWSANRVQSTPRRSVPEVPRILHTPIEEVSDDSDPIVTSPYADHFELRWSVAVDNGEPIDHYSIQYCPGRKINGAWNEIENLCVSRVVSVAVITSFEMTDLQSDTYYRIELRAHNAIGFSPPAHLLLKTARGLDVVVRYDNPALSSAAIIGLSVGLVLLILILIDLLCCIKLHAGVLALLCGRKKRSPSDLDDEAKHGSGNLVKERPPSPLPLPPPIVKLGPITPHILLEPYSLSSLYHRNRDDEENQPLNNKHNNATPTLIKNNSSVEFNGRTVQSRSGDLIGKNSAV